MRPSTDTAQRSSRSRGRSSRSSPRFSAARRSSASSAASSSCTRAAASCSAPSAAASSVTRRPWRGARRRPDGARIRPAGRVTAGPAARRRGLEESPDTTGQDAGASQRAKADGKWHRKQTASGGSPEPPAVRVKRWGKSPPATAATRRLAKPRPVQGEQGPPRGCPPRARVAAKRDGHPRQNPAYRPATEKALETGLFLL